MFPYWLLFTICAAGAIEHRRRGERAVQGGPLLFATAAFAALMIGLRFQVGGDWENYLRMFEYFHFGRLSEALLASDPGYTFLNWLTQRLGAGVWLVNLFCAAIFAWGLIKFAREQPNPWLVLVVAVPYLIIVVGMGYTRQAVAIGFLLAGLATLNKHSILRFAIYIAFAALFHKTAIIVLPLVGLSIVQKRGPAALLVALIGLLLYYFLLQSAVERFLTIYEEAAYDSQGAGIRVAMNVLPAAIYLLHGKRFQLPAAENRLWRIFSYAVLGTVALLFLLESSTAVDRMALYLIPLQLVVLPRLPYAFAISGRPNGQMTLLVIAYSATVQFVWLNYATHAGYWIPYQIYPLYEGLRGV